MRRNAFTLLETLISVVILGGLIAVVFEVFSVGVSGFKLGTTRLDLQSELRRILTPMRQDLRNTSFQSVSTTSVARDVPLSPPNLQPLTPVRRDGLCFGGLRDSLSDSSYDADTGFPLWDCYVVYFATLDEPDGKMARMTLRDSTPRDVLSLPRALSSSDLSMANPDLLDGNVRVLSQQLMDFEVSTDQGNQLVNVKLRLRGKAGHQDMGRRSTAEILEISTGIRPANTWPRL